MVIVAPQTGGTLVGYDTTWDKLRRIVRVEEPLCRACLRVGMITASGKNDSLRLDRSNLQALCKPCHSRKTMRFIRPFSSRQP